MNPTHERKRSMAKEIISDPKLREAIKKYKEALEASKELVVKQAEEKVLSVLVKERKGIK